MKSSTKWRILAGAAGLLLAACGGNADDTGAAKDGVSASSAKPAKANVDASAEEVASEARGKLKCPPKLATPPRAAGLPVDDILGVRPGLTYDEAANLVLCSHELLVIGQGAGRRLEMQTYGQQIRTGFAAGFAHARVQKTSRQVMQELQDSAIARGTNRVVRDMQPGQSKWYVGTVGIPGEERVINVAREEWFEDGKFPTIAGIEAALVKKYGVPTDVYPGFNGGRGLSLHWKYDPQAQPRSNLPCVGTADPEGGSSYSQRCGLTVEARIFPPRENPDLAEYFQIGITDQNGGYERILATEQALQQLDEQRRRQEVQQAASNADAPRL